jgi:outer membrane protein OmpA-like peptidoglycan-associated protein
MLKINRIMSVVIFLVAGSRLLLAGSLLNPGSAFLKIGLGARAVGMGNAFVAVADNPDAVFWNPAGLSQLENSHFAFTHIQWFQQVQYEALSGAQSLSDRLTFGLGLQFLHTSGIERRFTANDIEPVNTFSSGQFAAKIALAGRLPVGLAWGISGHLIQQQIDYQSCVGSGLDAGLLLNPANSGFRAGVAVQNLGSKLKFFDEEFDLPLTVRVGAAQAVFDQMLLLSGQAAFVRYFPPRYGLGSEVRFDLGNQPNPPALAFRVGYQWQPAEQAQPGYCAGVGFRFPFGNLAYSLDYAFQPYGFLGETHHFSLNVHLNQDFKVDIQAQPDCFSPNQDGYLDQTEFKPVVKNLKYAKDWKLTILDLRKQPVKIFAGSHFPPVSIAWNGTDDAGTALPDGRYFYALAVRREDGKNGKSVLKPITIDLQGPLVDAFASPDYILLGREQSLPAIRFELTQYRRLDAAEMDRLKAWKLDVFDSQQRVLKSFSREGALPEAVIWDSPDKNKLNPLEMLVFYQLTAWDFWGNMARSPAKQITIKQDEAKFSRRYHFTIDNVMFDTDQATLRPDGIEALQRVVQVLLANSGSYVHVEGHTDSRGTDAHNLALSLARGNTVGIYLMQHAHVAPDHISVVPYGESRPRATNSSEQGMQLNRRVEIYIFVKDSNE